MNQEIVQYIHFRELYLVCSNIVTILILVINFKINQYAKKNKLDSVRRWAAPALISCVFSTLGVAFEDLLVSIHAAESLRGYMISASLHTVGYIFGGFSAVRLWHMVRGMTPPNIDASSSNTIWPPPPAPPR